MRCIIYMPLFGSFNGTKSFATFIFRSKFLWPIPSLNQSSM